MGACYSGVTRGATEEVMCVLVVRRASMEVQGRVEPAADEEPGLSAVSGTDVWPLEGIAASEERPAARLGDTRTCDWTPAARICWARAHVQHCQTSRCQKKTAVVFEAAETAGACALSR